MNYDGTQLERLRAILNARKQRDEALHQLEMMRGQRWFWLVAGVVIGWVLF